MNIKLPEEITSKALPSHVREFLFTPILFIFSWKKKMSLGKKMRTRFQKAVRK